MGYRRHEKSPNMQSPNEKSPTVEKSKSRQKRKLGLRMVLTAHRRRRKVIENIALDKVVRLGLARIG